MISPERNDVEISKLFTWGKMVTIENHTFYLRVAGDADINRARVHALRRSAEMRRKLKDLNSDERLAYVAEEDLVERENLIEFLLVATTKKAMMESIEKVEVPFPKEPDSDATLEEQEKYQEEVDTWPARREESVRKFIMDKADKQRAVLNEKTKEELYKLYVDERINELCEVEMRIAFTEMCVCNNVFTDETCQQKVFATVEEFRNLPTSVKMDLQEEYNALEIPMDELKK